MAKSKSGNNDDALITEALAFVIVTVEEDKKSTRADKALRKRIMPIYERLLRKEERQIKAGTEAYWCYRASDQTLQRVVPRAR